jgi:signal transduction histidine kinase
VWVITSKTEPPSEEAFQRGEHSGSGETGERQKTGEKMRAYQGILKIRDSVTLKFMCTYTILVLALLIFLNTYPLVATRDLVFRSKENTLMSQAMVFSTTLSVLDILSQDGVSQTMELLDSGSLDRVIVTDDSGLILYDTSDSDSGVGRYALFSEISRAIEGKTVFRCQFTEGAFLSKAAVPIRNHGTTIGSVYLYEYDAEQGELIAGIQRNLLNISLGIGFATVLLVYLLTRALTVRITDLVKAIGVVRDGDYNYRVPVRGSDELAELSDEFNNMTQRLQDTEELRRRFVSDASHELKTPLASIRLLADSVVQSTNMDEQMMREFVVDIGNEAERLQRITEKLMSLTKLDSEIRQAPEPVELDKIIQETFRMLKPLADRREIYLSYAFRNNCVVLAAEDEIYQVIFNLVENAIKYNVPGGSVALTLYSKDGFAVMEVEDTGIGIPESDLPNIFSRFYRVDKARSREAGGSGLGLSIVHDAVERNGGTVTVERREPRGTRFRVRFPAYYKEA